MKYKTSVKQKEMTVHITQNHSCSKSTYGVPTWRGNREGFMDEEEI